MGGLSEPNKLSLDPLLHPLAEVEEVFLDAAPLLLGKVFED